MNTRYIVEQTRDKKGIFSWIDLGPLQVWVGSLELKGQISKSLTTRWVMIPTEDLCRPLWIGGKLLMYSKPIIGNDTDCKLVG